MKERNRKGFFFSSFSLFGKRLINQFWCVHQFTISTGLILVFLFSSFWIHRYLCWKVSFFCLFLITNFIEYNWQSFNTFNLYIKIYKSVIQVKLYKWNHWLPEKRNDLLFGLDYKIAFFSIRKYQQQIFIFFILVLVLLVLLLFLFLLPFFCLLIHYFFLLYKRKLKVYLGSQFSYCSHKIVISFFLTKVFIDLNS